MTRVMSMQSVIAPPTQLPQYGGVPILMLSKGSTAEHTRVRRMNTEYEIIYAYSIGEWVNKSSFDNDTKMT